jgi:hypothetical protein
MYEYVQYAENVPLLATLFHMCTWVEWVSHARIGNYHDQLDVFFDAINSKRFNGFSCQARMLGVLQHELQSMGGGESVVTITSYLCIASLGFGSIGAGIGSYVST